ncbi:hypothetical protein PXO_02137 [Xanthomonas oryzae pv. oryzae PXO99A]|uniref:Uncharacterized protein n=1 Tax=Xanthomonas oryzae pv. oryzae (strain PXO99A) TaxID=360094 RepID=A0A0K0GNT6_XANOP|nr:hypothetical protein PXO_02137 [Xanthomonas oryzae pv. oryzae PXO99A]
MVIASIEAMNNRRSEERDNGDIDGFLWILVAKQTRQQTSDKRLARANRSDPCS